MPDLLEIVHHPTVLLTQVLIAIGGIFLAEVIRDLYHVAGHYWQPLQAGHTLHHKAYRPDLSIVSLKAYCEAQWHNDVPEALVMVILTGAIAIATQTYALAVGSFYAFLFLTTSVARSRGWLLSTDLTHKPGDLVTVPSTWTVNRTYHWRHHFDRGDAYFCSTFTLVDKILGTCLSLEGKTVAVTGASGALGKALIAQLAAKQARIIALTTSDNTTFTDLPENSKIEIVTWQPGNESELSDRLKKVDILIINHGISVGGERSPAAIQASFEANTFSVWRLMEIFFGTVTESKHKALKEVWINTSEAEVSPAFSPLYELSKRTIGDLITLRRLDAPCVVRKLILGPFKSSLNPIGVMSPEWVAWAIIALAQRDFRNIIVAINPITYIAFPLKEFLHSLYFRLFSQGKKK